jgi:hypothetical protein
LLRERAKLGAVLFPIGCCAHRSFLLFSIV